MKIIVILLLLIYLISCTEDNEYIPFYQDAIYIMNTDGDNKQKVIDVNYCKNVQFIPNSNKILFMTSRNDGSQMKQLLTVNIDGSDSLQISGQYLLRDAQPSVSEDGSKIVFWALPDSRDYSYDLYMTDPLGTEIINLTNTEDESEKDASFINYQDHEYLLYVTYFNESETNFSTISLMNIETFEIDTLYIEEIEEEWGFKHPLYCQSYEILFVVSGQVGTTASSYLYSYDSLYNGNSVLIPTEVYGYKMDISLDFHKLIFQSHDIMTYDILQNEVNLLVGGYKFDTYLDKMIFCTRSQSNDGDIYSIKLDGSDNTLLSEDGFYPRFSSNGDKIVFIGRYNTNPRRDLITN